MSDQIRRAKALLESKGYTVSRKLRESSDIDATYYDEDYYAEIDISDIFPEARSTDEYDDNIVAQVESIIDIRDSQIRVYQGMIYIEDISEEDYERVVAELPSVLKSNSSRRVDPVNEFIQAERKYLNMKTQELVKLARSRQDDMSRDNVDDIALAAACEAHNIHEYAEVDGMHWVPAIERLTGERIMNIISRR